MTEPNARVVDLKEIFPKKEDIPDSGGMADVFAYLTRAGGTVPPWWSKSRDKVLRRFWKGNDNLSGAIYAFISRMTSIPLQVIPVDKSIEAHTALAKRYEDILINHTTSRSDRSIEGWVGGWGLFLQDLVTQDNGAFFAIEGPGKATGPLTGMPTGLVHLDSFRVTRKHDPEFPIVYEDWDGKLYKIHHTRVISMSSLSSPDIGMCGVGLCAISRCVNFAQILVDQLIYKQEKLGSRPKERLIIGKKGITAEEIAMAFAAVDDQMDAEGLTRYAKTAVIAPSVRNAGAEIDIDVQDLVDAGNLFDEQTSTTLGMYTISLAFGVPARWFWPATATGATKADAQYQHLAGMVQGPGEIIRAITTQLDNKFLPPTLRISSDYQDDEQDRQQAEIRKSRADQRKTDLESSVITVRVAREQALESGDITQAQFDMMELDDGRLPNGDAVLAAFSIEKDEQLQEMLDLGVEQPLSTDDNDAIQMIITIDEKALEVQALTQNAPSAQQRRKARIALSALGQLKGLYEQAATDEIVSQLQFEMNVQNAIAGAEAAEAGLPPTPPAAPAPEPEQPQEQPQEQPPAPGEQAMETKAYDFSVGAGQVIGGGLARDAAGRFISADSISSEVRNRLLAKLRGEKGDEKDEELTEAEGRAKVYAALSSVLPDGSLEALSAMIFGEVPAASQGLMATMLQKGLVKVNEAGAYQVTSSGAGVLIAANEGDVKKAKEALIMAAVQKKPPPAPKAGAAPKAAAEEKPKEEPQTREEQEAADAQANRDALVEKISEESGIDADAMEAFNTFFEGGDLSEDYAGLFSSLGLVDIDENGNPRMTSSGRTFMNAANKGDIRRARDIISAALEALAELDNTVGETPARLEEIQRPTDRLRQPEEPAPAPSKPTTSTPKTESKPTSRPTSRFSRPTDSIKGKNLFEQVRDLLKKKSLAEKSASSYNQDIRRWARSLWTGVIDIVGFESEMFAVVQDGLTQAWNVGIEEIGFTYDDLTIREKQELQRIIVDETSQVPSLSSYIRANNKESGTPFSTILVRVELWAQRYKDVMNTAKAMVGKDKKLKWVLGDAEHCKTCTALAGKVKRASFWYENVVPQDPPNHKLDCGGWKCQCDLVETDEPVSQGPLPSLP